MTTSQTIVICSCILATSVIDVSYREWEKAPARKAAREAQAAKKFQEEWSATKFSLRYFEQACRGYFHGAESKRGNVAEFQKEASMWLATVASFVTAYPQSMTVYTTMLADFVPQVQPALTSPSDETIRAAWELADKVCKQHGIE